MTGKVKIAILCAAALGSAAAHACTSWVLHPSVTKSHRNKGIGTDLIRTAESYAKTIGIPVITFHVEKANRSAFQLYERLGYAIYQEDGSRYLMIKNME